MLEKPPLPEEKIISCLQDAFDLHIAQINFLPIGADLNTAVYRAVTAAGTPYFVKLRSGTFDEITVTLPKYLSDQGIPQIIAPLASKTGQFWADLAHFKVILYPYIAGHNGFEVGLADHHWTTFGAALKRVHTTPLPASLKSDLRQEDYTPKWRETVKTSLERIAVDTFHEPVAVEVAAFLNAKRAVVLDLVQRAERLAIEIQDRSPLFILCHSDIHAGNLLIDEANDALYMVDWDDPILAPKERDLMYVGGGLGGDGHTPQEEERLFYQGYGPTDINPVALAYYRYERIVVDIAIYCEQLLFSEDGGEDRAQSLYYLKSNFDPMGTIEIAYGFGG